MSIKYRFHPISLALLWTLWTPILSAQPPGNHKIVGKIKGLATATAYLAHFYGPTQYIPRDTAQADAEGQLVFDGEKNLPEGLYMIVVNGKRIMDLIIGEKIFSFETDTTHIVESMRVNGSRENTIFYEYQDFLEKKTNEITTLQQQRKTQQDATAKRQIDNQITNIQQAIETYRQTFLRKNAGTLTVKLLQAANEPIVPPAPKLPNGQPDSSWVFTYYKKHYLDDFDFSDERMLRTPFLQRKLNRYIQELTVQTVDSLIPAADYLISCAKANKEIQSFTIWYLTNQYQEQKNVLNTEGLFIHLAEKYWLTGIMQVNDSSSLKTIRERVQTLKPLLAGKTLPNISLQDTLGRFHPLHDVKAEYTVVFFYDPECAHCRESTPKLKKFYEANKAKGVQVYAVALEKSIDVWKQYIREFKVGNFINVYGPSAPINYRSKYDVYSTPTVYILDRNKKILARRLPVEDLEGYLQFLQRSKPTQQDAKASVK